MHCGGRQRTTDRQGGTWIRPEPEEEEEEEEGGLAASLRGCALQKDPLMT
jgi:hypothetical protein